MEHGPIILLPLKVGGIDVSITNQVLLLFAAAAMTFVFVWLGVSRKRLYPLGVFQNLVEVTLDFIKENIAAAFLKDKASTWLPFLTALFFFVLFNNLLGLLPFPGFIVTATSNINVTATLAVMVFVVAQVVGIRHHGIMHYVRILFPKSAPAWLRFSIMPVIELISLLAKPFSHAVRLFANMTAGHKIIATFILGEFVGINWLLQNKAAWGLVKPLAIIPFALVVAMNAFEIFVAFIQAFIFALLAALYLSEVLEEGH
jgi:F-type H+-transporting ATPase subunit a